MAYLSVVASFGFDPMPPDQMLPGFAKLGLRGAQYHRHPDFDVEPADVRRFAEAEGFPFHSIHGIFGPDIDPASPDEALRRASVARYEGEARLARRLGARMVVVHPSVATEQQHGSDARREALIRSARELSRIGTAHGVWMLLENLPGNYGWGFDTAALATLVRELDLPRIAMCFDTGHAHMTGSADEALAACRDVVRCVHVHDNDAMNDSHDLPGDGTIDWTTLGPALASLPDTVPLALEIFPTPDELQDRESSGYAATLSGWFRAVPAT